MTPEHLLAFALAELTWKNIFLGLLGDTYLVGVLLWFRELRSVFWTRREAKIFCTICSMLWPLLIVLIMIQIVKLLITGEHRRERRKTDDVDSHP